MFLQSLELQLEGIRLVQRRDIVFMCCQLKDFYYYFYLKKLMDEKPLAMV